MELKNLAFKINRVRAFTAFKNPISYCDEWELLLSIYESVSEVRYRAGNGSYFVDSGRVESFPKVNDELYLKQDGGENTLSLNCIKV